MSRGAGPSDAALTAALDTPARTSSLGPRRRRSCSARARARQRRSSRCCGSSSPWRCAGWPGPSRRAGTGLGWGVMGGRGGCRGGIGVESRGCQVWPGCWGGLLGGAYEVYVNTHTFAHACAHTGQLHALAGTPVLRVPRGVHPPTDTRSCTLAHLSTCTHTGTSVHGYKHLPKLPCAPLSLTPAHVCAHVHVHACAGICRRMHAHTFTLAGACTHTGAHARTYMCTQGRCCLGMV